MKLVSADGTTIYICVHRWSKYDKVPYLGHKLDSNPLFPIANPML